MVSMHDNKYAESITTSFGWSYVFPIQTKCQAHESLSLLFQYDEVPPACVIDGLRKQTMGKFKKKLRVASCHLRQTEPHSPWQNAAELTIRELAKGIGRKMVITEAPKLS